jgi:hypothetical protein
MQTTQTPNSYVLDVSFAKEESYSYMRKKISYPLMLSPLGVRGQNSNFCCRLQHLHVSAQPPLSLLPSKPCSARISRDLLSSPQAQLHGSRLPCRRLVSTAGKLHNVWQRWPMAGVPSIAALEGTMEAKAAALDGGGDIILAMGGGCRCLLVVTLAD